ncbi:MAG: DUF4124 domain-containing protein [Gammaproteobacteria bacterium]|nr:DUF4124 domain-containing protein [Gammaproteobacteria bacterium]
MTRRSQAPRLPCPAGAAAYLAGTLMLIATASAETLYRSTDAEGATTYSDRPPAEAVETETVSVPPAPSAETIEQSRQRTMRQRELADELAGERKARQAEQEAAKRDRPVTPVPPAQSENDDGPDYGYPYHPRWPGRPNRPGYPPEWEGPRAPPVLRPPGQRPRPPAKPTPLPATGGILRP